MHSIGFVFTDAETGMAIEGLNVEMNGQKKKTHTDGSVSFEKVPETAGELWIRTRCYNLVRDFDFTSDTTCSIALYKTRYLIDFQVSDRETGVPLIDLDIMINDSILGTDFIFRNCGPFQYQILKEGASLFQGNGYLESDTTIIAELYTGSFPVNIQVYDPFNDEGISAANVLFGDQMEVTDGNGDLTLFASPGSHLLSVSADDYSSFIDTVAIANSGVDLNVPLELLFADLKFVLEEEGTPVNNAIITLGGDEELTNALGMAFFRKLNVGMTYHFSIQKENYLDILDSVNIPHHTEVFYEMIPTGYGQHTLPGLKVYPNPAEHCLVIESNERIQRIRIADSSGRIVMERDMQAACVCSVELGDLTNGLFILSVDLSEDLGTYNRKIHVLR